MVFEFACSLDQSKLLWKPLEGPVQNSLDRSSYRNLRTASRPVVSFEQRLKAPPAILLRGPATGCILLCSHVGRSKWVLGAAHCTCFCWLLACLTGWLLRFPGMLLIPGHLPEKMRTIQRLFSYLGSNQFRPQVKGFSMAKFFGKRAL